MIAAPPPSSIRDNSGQAIHALRQRCAAMGLPTWRCDNAGLIISEPADTTPVALLWGSAAFSSRIENIAAAWAAQDDPDITEIFPGAWAIPLPEQRRRTRTGVLMAVAFSEEGLGSEFFDSACIAAALDAGAIRRILLPRARYSKQSALSLRDSILWMAKDLLHVQECDHTAAGFTRQLSDSFETIDLLYSLGRSMSDLTRPAEFVDTMASRDRKSVV